MIIRTYRQTGQHRAPLRSRSGTDQKSHSHAHRTKSVTRASHTHARSLLDGSKHHADHRRKDRLNAKRVPCAVPTAHRPRYNASRCHVR